MDKTKLTDEDYLQILYLLLRHSAIDKALKLWQSFDNEIHFNSRFFPEGELLATIESLQHQAEFQIKQGEKFYRARLYEEHFLGYYSGEKKKLTNLVAEYYPEMKDRSIDEIYSFLAMHNFSVSSNKELWDKLKNLLQRRKRFWGYNTKDSDAPPSKVASAGRANSKYISYLYIANDVKTAISELRPHKDQEVSVAAIRIEKDLKIYNFCSAKTPEMDDNFFLLKVISELFSDTKNGNDYDYYATQYICEYIRKMGFDGIRFKSSLNPKGMNVVLFDTTEDKKTKKKNYTILNSKVYLVTNVDVQYNQIAPLRIK